MKNNLYINCSLISVLEILMQLKDVVQGIYYLFLLVRNTINYLKNGIVYWKTVIYSKPQKLLAKVTFLNKFEPLMKKLCNK